MAVNVGKTKFIIFHIPGKHIDPNLKLHYDDNEPNEYNTNLVYEVERIHKNRISPENRSYKLLGIHLNDFFHLITTLNIYAPNSTNPYTVLTGQKIFSLTNH
jgi:hypothetical protein